MPQPQPLCFRRANLSSDRIHATSTPFDMNLLTLDFPAMTLHCLPPPPALYQSTPLPSPTSWSILPPDHQQFEALRTYFREAWQHWRINSAIASARILSSSRPSTPLNEHTDRLARDNQEYSLQQEEKLQAHLTAAFSLWNSLPPANRLDIWRLELARALGRKSDALTQLQEQQSYIQQENEHLRTQVEQLSRCQAPREFRAMPPRTVPMDAKTLPQMVIMHDGAGIGLTLEDAQRSAEEQVEVAIGRWKEVVQASRRAGSRGMEGQQRFDSVEARRMDEHTRRLETYASGLRGEDVDMDMEKESPEMDGAENYSDIRSEQQQGQAGTSGRSNDETGISVSFAGRAPQAPMMRMGGGPANGQQHGRPANGSGRPEWQGQSSGTHRIGELDGRRYGD